MTFRLLNYLILVVLLGCKESFIDCKYSYSRLDSCVTPVYALDADERFAFNYAKWYSSGVLDFPNGTTTSDYIHIELEYSVKVDIIKYSSDCTYAQVRFPNPWIDKYVNAYKQKYMYGFIPVNLLHDEPAYWREKCK